MNAQPTTLVNDPVCGMPVDESGALTVRHDGRDYYFCEPACAEIFEAEPERWLEQSPTVEHRHG